MPFTSNVGSGTYPISKVELTEGGERLVYSLKGLDVIVWCPRFQCVDAELLVIERQVRHAEVYSNDRDDVKLVSEDQIKEGVVTPSRAVVHLELALIPVFFIEDEECYLLSFFVVIFQGVPQQKLSPANHFHLFGVFFVHLQYFHNKCFQGERALRLKYI